MKKYAMIILSLTSFLSVTVSNAANNNLLPARQQIIKQYLHDLKTANVQAISQLFTESGVVISTSQGRQAPAKFFNSFLPKLASAEINIIRDFIDPQNDDRLASQFHFSYKMQSGEKGGGEYIDEFLFAPNTIKLQEVYMFENLK